MCWQTRDIPIKEIAGEDIPVFKVMYDKKDGLESFYTGFEYEIGKLYAGDMENPKDNGAHFAIHEGFHSYSIKCECIINNEYPYSFFALKSLDLIRPILHLAPSIGKIVMVDCTIPKGAKYYINEHGEYVSNKIIINKIREDVLDL